MKEDYEKATAKMNDDYTKKFKNMNEEFENKIASKEAIYAASLKKIEEDRVQREQDFE
jgi:hypothetical protein